MECAWLQADIDGYWCSSNVMASEAEDYGVTSLQSKSQKYATEAAHAKAITRKTKGMPGMPSAPVHLWER